MEIINITCPAEGVPDVVTLANRMPTAATRAALLYWIEKNHNAGEDHLALVYFDRRDDDVPGFKVVCTEIEKTFVFNIGDL